MEGEKALEQFSPELIIRNPSSSGAVPLLPRIVLFHGTSDYSIPLDERLVGLFENDTFRIENRINKNIKKICSVFNI